VKNKKWKFVPGCPRRFPKAGAAADLGKNGHAAATEIWIQTGDESYPISLIHVLDRLQGLRNLASKGAAQDLAGSYGGTHDGQRYAADLGYARSRPECSPRRRSTQDSNYKERRSRSANNSAEQGCDLNVQASGQMFRQRMCHPRVRLCDRWSADVGESPAYVRSPR